jgi:uncharacterized coiled-coil DUF342 family protein
MPTEDEWAIIGARNAKEALMKMHVDELNRLHKERCQLNNELRELRSKRHALAELQESLVFGEVRESAFY